MMVSSSPYSGTCGAPSEITKIKPFFLEKFELEFLPEDLAEKSTPPGEGKGRRSSIVLVYEDGIRAWHRNRLKMRPNC